MFTLHAAVGVVADEVCLTGSALLRRVKVDGTFVTSGAVEAVVTGTLWGCGVEGKETFTWTQLQVRNMYLV